jgi:hypothetical protein
MNFEVIMFGGEGKMKIKTFLFTAVLAGGKQNQEGARL